MVWKCFLFGSSKEVQGLQLKISFEGNRYHYREKRKKQIQHISQNIERFNKLLALNLFQ